MTQGSGGEVPTDMETVELFWSKTYLINQNPHHPAIIMKGVVFRLIDAKLYHGLPLLPVTGQHKLCQPYCGRKIPIKQKIEPKIFGSSYLLL
jgi:hypothetical protein